LVPEKYGGSAGADADGAGAPADAAGAAADAAGAGSSAKLRLAIVMPRTRKQLKIRSTLLLVIGFPFEGVGPTAR
jgi:hypothetical protein